jgi:ATP-dependent protease ClpP protease subunit
MRENGSAVARAAGQLPLAGSGCCARLENVGHREISLSDERWKVVNPMSAQNVTYVKFFVAVDAATIGKLTQLLQDRLKAGSDRFVLLISSPGGNVFSGVTGYNFLKGIPAEVLTHNCGSVDSIAAVLFCAGSTRYCVPHARFLLHGIGFDVTAPSRFDEKLLDERIKSLRLDRENISRIIADNTGRSRQDVETDILEGTALNSQQAIEYGLAHEIKIELFPKGVELFEVT